MANLVRMEPDALIYDPSDHESASDATVASLKQIEAEDPQIRAAREERQSLTARETKAVRCIRIVASAVLSLTAILVSWCVYAVARGSEESSFQAENEASASKIIESFHGSLEQLLDSFDALSVSITSHALDFEALGASTWILSRATFIQYTPLVTDENRKEWEAYSVKNLQ